MNLALNDISTALKKKWWFQNKRKSYLDCFLNLIADICNKFPSPLKKMVFRAVDSFGLALYRVLNILFFLISPHYLMNGNQKDNNKNIQFLVKGDPDSFSTLTDIMCNSITQLKRVSSTMWKNHHKNYKVNKKSPDVLMLKTDIFYQEYLQQKGYEIIPEYVSFILPVKNDIDSIISNTSSDIQEDISRAMNTGYTYEIRNDKNAFEFFYFQMYLPYIKWRHHESKKIASYATIKHLVGQGAEILFIKHKQNIIFGGMFLRNNNIIETHYAGLMKGKFNHLHNGIMALSYYYLIKTAINYDCSYIDFGTAPSFISDGLYHYKKKWNMIVTPPSPIYSDIFAIKIIKNNSPIVDFIKTHPMHCLRGNKLEILSGLN